MAKINVIISPEADRDLLDVWRYIAGDNVDSADGVLDRFAEGFERIARFPYSGERYQKGTIDLRRIIVKPYVVFYRVMEDERVEIVRVFHGARNWEALL